MSEKEWSRVQTSYLLACIFLENWRTFTEKEIKETLQKEENAVYKIQKCLLEQPEYYDTMGRWINAGAIEIDGTRNNWGTVTGDYEFTPRAKNFLKMIKEAHEDLYPNLAKSRKKWKKLISGNQ